MAAPRPALWALPGAIAGLLPQEIFNLAVLREFSLVPVQTPLLSAVQAEQAPYAIRYDTVVSLPTSPQQWYCDPHYAASLVSDPVATGQLDVVGSVARHLPHSLWFLSEKAAAAMFWTASMPYELARRQRQPCDDPRHPDGVGRFGLHRVGRLRNA